MKMARKRLLVRLGCAAAFFLALTLYWYHGHQPIAYHNECIHSAIETAVRIEVANITRLDHQPKEVTITNREEIVGLLNHLELPWSMRASGMAHLCSGHLRINIIMPNPPNYDVQYDHGVGVYPIYTGGPRPGFNKLSGKSCDYLNAYFLKLGYSKEELGIHQ